MNILRFVLLFAGGAVCSHGVLATGAGIVTIDFEHLPGPDGRLGTPDDAPVTPGGIISDQFEALNVCFLLDPAFPEHTNVLRHWTPFDSHSLTTLYPHGDGRSGQVRGEFTEPVSSITARIAWRETPAEGNRLYAYREDGSIIAFADATSSQQLVTIDSSEPIYSFAVDGRLSAPTYAVLDDLSFNVIPAPATAVFLALMVGAPAMRRRRLTRVPAFVRP